MAGYNEQTHPVEKGFKVEEVNVDDNTQKEINPSNIFDKAFMTWLTPLMKLGYRKALQPEDLYNVNKKNQASVVSHVLEPFWHALATYLDDKTKPSPHPFRFMLKAFFLPWFISVTFAVLSVCSELAIPIFIQQLLLYVQPVESSRREDLWIHSGIGIAFCVLGLQVSTTLCRVVSEQLVRTVMMDVRTVLIGAIYEKSLRLSGQSAQKFSQGKIMNMINVDAETISFNLFFMNMLITSPIQIAVAIILLVRLLGATVWAGVGAMIGLFLLQIPAMIFSKKYQVKILAAGDARLKGVRESLYAIKIIKLRAWEDFFLKKVSALRERQVAALKGNYVSFLGFISIGQLTPIIMPIVAFVVYSSVNGFLDPTVVFPALILFNILFAPMLDLPQSATNLIMAIVSWGRVAEYLVTSETQPLAIAPISSNGGDHPEAVTISDATFKWETVKVDEAKKKGSKRSKKRQDTKERDASPNHGDLEPADSSMTLVPPESKSSTDDQPTETLPLFRNLNLTIERGSLTAVVGSVGSGKSSLLSAIIGEMSKLDGKVHVRGTVAYCTQQPWIQTETLKANILFGQPYDEKRLQNVVQVCGLEADLHQLPTGIDTEIGEKGVNLSGGQKARVALARAVYENCDIYLLDDPISALDAQVGQAVYIDCIKGALAGKTRVLVTHHLHLLQNVDKIIVLEDGVVVEQGTFEGLVASGGHFTEMMKDYQLDDTSEEEEESNKVTEVKDASSESRKEAGGLIVAEDRVIGAIRWKTYKAYIVAAGGGWWAGATIAMLALLQLSSIMTNYWLTWWAERKFAWESDGYLLGYGLLGAALAIMTVSVNAILFYGNYKVAKKIHRAAFKRLLQAPMGFFDSQPVGRILNRFSKDVDAIDRRLWADVLLTLISIAHILGTIVLLSVVSPYMLLFFTPISALYYYILRFYRSSFRELKRLDSNQRSPLFSQISESLTGIPTIRAYKAEERFVKRQRMLMDLSNAPYFLMMIAQLWITIRLELFTSLIVFILAMLGVTKVVAGTLIGLAFTYAVPLTQYINMILRSFALLESNLNSVERLQEYATELPEEAPAIKDSDPPCEAWPKGGEIAIRDIELRYPSRPEHPVIRDLSLEISPGEKIGIVGRTGSGKSTLLTALFRVVELSKGSISIDGQDIAKLGLKTLRSRMQIIPQEPVLFTGTIRSNLDVENQFSDAEIWETLERINLKTYVSSLPDKLESPVTENGENLSVGQRQLICLGRAILMKPIILVMDEATASVDAQADQLIQRSIKTHFANATVLSIAHRLNTIADFDRVLVLDNGCRAEFDSPHNLLARPESLFSQLVDATGAANAQLLREIAAQHDQRRLDVE
ncbi:uncharacterized protein SPPG_04462 [Spizellomyces punctatus DAOM BR117]|uniref:P-loop containing nucleoside triphosphate hydrolase protein n=1 Tax=Spizellomyces punctatus (strain DAOM BR117) TaxID=645134 RepID=A0A0L0HGX7_SPIPD|nr:uncharacterized protein SPPG_04462 [Spizellomyces punctatus DAOM BR117]KND00120.1 hypothetical protein SPPG_04462 [Spizellomyces punctatus DAOM BR117]|eukprot:XP_016608159.1 hypothetical protein SPPG_04462 [Spizellomyces punctatus DAOM BR117]